MIRKEVPGSPVKMLVPILLTLGGFVLLIKGADWLIDHAASLARKYNISDLAIGLTVVAFGTSMPELVINTMAALDNLPEIVFGNVIGSNIINILLILGITGLICPISVHASTIWKEIPVSLGAAGVLLVLANGWLPLSGPGLSQLDGVWLLLLFGGFLYYIYLSMRSTQPSPTTGSDTRSILFICLGLGAGLAGLIIGGRLVVENTIYIAREMGLSEEVIGLTIIAAGTSLPELVTSATAAWRRNADLAIGNVIGSNIFNILFVLGVSAAINPLAFNLKFNVDIVILATATGLLFLAMFTGGRGKLDRPEAGIMVVGYIIYVVLLLR